MYVGGMFVALGIDWSTVCRSVERLREARAGRRENGGHLSHAGRENDVCVVIVFLLLLVVLRFTG